MSSSTRRRALAAAGTVVVAAAMNVTTGLFTEKWALAWGVFTVIVIVIGGALQAWLAIADKHGDHNDAPGSQLIDEVKVGGSIRQEMQGPGRQRTAKSEVEGDLSQVQQSTRHDPRP